MIFHGGLEVMVWEMISYEGDSVLERLDNTLDGPGYLNLLKRCERWRGFMDETLSFQHDKAGPPRYTPCKRPFC